MLLAQSADLLAASNPGHQFVPLAKRGDDVGDVGLWVDAVRPAEPAPAKAEVWMTV